MKTFNKRGDGGETSLLYGGRVPKNDPHCEAYGTIDEAVSALGLARALVRKERVQDILQDIQPELFIVGSEMATLAEQYHKLAAKHRVVTEEMVDRLETIIEELEGDMEMPKTFIMPGASPGAAALDLARTIIRRAERRAVALKKQNMLSNERVLHYLNRLADLIYTLARYEEG
ncbi:MAG: cob(I)yrinic acid a,c-diamide adenosyltransferase [Chloroflexi bacterium]|nr:MAG: cob(I)yrinic acid a,c-diamide adenosyltransferase [Chloroflexota bacterium]